MREETPREIFLYLSFRAEEKSFPFLAHIIHTPDTPCRCRSEEQAS
jgi:hypothetical protein